MGSAAMTGFRPGGKILRPETPLQDDLAERAKRVAAAMTLGATPEDITRYLTAGDGFPDHVEAFLDRPHTDEEMADHAGIWAALINGQGA